MRYVDFWVLWFYDKIVCIVFWHLCVVFWVFGFWGFLGFCCFYVLSIFGFYRNYGKIVCIVFGPFLCGFGFVWFCVVFGFYCFYVLSVFGFLCYRVIFQKMYFRVVLRKLGFWVFVIFGPGSKIVFSRFSCFPFSDDLSLFLSVFGGYVFR